MVVAKFETTTQSFFAPLYRKLRGDGMSEWKMVRLGDIFDLQMGKTPDRNRPEYFNTNTNKWVSIADISKAQKYILETKECISDEAVKNSGIKQIPANTIIMSFKLSIGKTAITTEPMYSNEAIMAFLPNGKYEVDNDFFYHLFSNKNWSEGSNKAVKGVTLNKATLTEVKIPLPPLDEQKQIAAVLDKCTAIIAKRKQQLSALDELIKARFVEMFGDESNPFKWPVICVENVVNVSVGVVIKPAQYYTDAEHGVKAFRSLNIGPMTIKDSDWVYFSYEGHNKNSKSQLKENDLLIVRSGAPGMSCVVPKQYEGCNAIDIIIARPNIDQVNPYYLCMYTNMPHGKRQIEEGTGGAAQQHFNVGKYNKLQLMLPPINLQNEFSCFIAQVDKTKEVVKKSLNRAQLLFDSLMQRYFG